MLIDRRCDLREERVGAHDLYMHMAVLVLSCQSTRRNASGLIEVSLRARRVVQPVRFLGSRRLIVYGKPRRQHIRCIGIAVKTVMTANNATL